MRAFELFLGLHEEWRRHGVTLRTRILSEAASAAAVLVSLGNERLAERGAILSFHCTRFSPGSWLDAGTTTTLSSLHRDAGEVYGVEPAVLGAEVLPPDPFGHPTDTTNAWTRTSVVFTEHVLDALPEWCVPLRL